MNRSWGRYGYSRRVTATPFSNHRSKWVSVALRRLNARHRVPHHLSKSRFVTGLQGQWLLRWKLHEPDALEPKPDRVLQDVFEHGLRVGEAVRGQCPGEALIDLPHTARV